MRFYNRFTKEEKQLDKEDTLQMLKKGFSQAQISIELGRSTQYICNIKKDLVNEGLITDEEILHIKELKKQEIKNNIPKPIDKRKIINTKKEIKKNNVLEGILNNKSPLELSNELNIPVTTVKRYIDELIKDKKLNSSQIKSKRSKNKDLIKIRNKNIIKDYNTKKYTNVELAKKYNISTALVSIITTNKYEETMHTSKKPIIKKNNNKNMDTSLDNSSINLSDKEKGVLSLLQAGTIYSNIENTLKISHKELLKIINNLKILNVISSKEIQDAKNKRIEFDKKDILTLLKNGCSISNIASKRPNLKLYYIKWLVKKIKQEELLSNDDIKNYIENSDTNQNFKNLVLNGMQKGLTVKQIIDLDKTEFATESKVRRMKDTLIKENKITKKEFKKNHKKNMRESKKEEKNNFDKKIYKLIKKGLTDKEISKYLNIKSSFIYNRKRKILSQKLLTKEDLEEFKNLRKQKQNEIRQLAKYETTQEKDTINHRKNFVKLIKDEISYGNKLSKDDIILFGKILVLNNEFISKENLKIVITEYFKFGTYKQIQQLLSDLISSYKDTQYEKPLIDFMEYARKNIMYKTTNNNDKNKNNTNSNNEIEK